MNSKFIKGGIQEARYLNKIKGKLKIMSASQRQEYGITSDRSIDMLNTATLLSLGDIIYSKDSFSAGGDFGGGGASGSWDED